MSVRAGFKPAPTTRASSRSVSLWFSNQPPQPTLSLTARGRRGRRPRRRPPGARGRGSLRWRRARTGSRSRAVAAIRPTSTARFGNTCSGARNGWADNRALADLRTAFARNRYRLRVVETTTEAQRHRGSCANRFVRRGGFKTRPYDIEIFAFASLRPLCLCGFPVNRRRRVADPCGTAQSGRSPTDITRSENSHEETYVRSIAWWRTHRQ